jgi:hypothetical protein
VSAVGWQRCNTTSSLQHHGIRSAFCKPGFESSQVSNKRDYSGTRDSLQERLQMSVQAIENSRPPQKVLPLTLVQAPMEGSNALEILVDLLICACLKPH